MRRCSYFECKQECSSQDMQKRSHGWCWKRRSGTVGKQTALKTSLHGPIRQLNSTQLTSRDKKDKKDNLENRKNKKKSPDYQVSMAEKGN